VNYRYGSDSERPKAAQTYCFLLVAQQPVMDQSVATKPNREAVE